MHIWSYMTVSGEQGLRESLHTSQPMGPQDQAKLATKTQMSTITPMATECGSVLECAK